MYFVVHFRFKDRKQGFRIKSAFEIAVYGKEPVLRSMAELSHDPELGTCGFLGGFMN